MPREMTMEEGREAILCEAEVSYRSLTKAIVAVVDTLVNKENGRSEGLFVGYSL